jgi:hypothetical protein
MRHRCTPSPLIPILEVLTENPLGLFNPILLPLLVNEILGLEPRMKHYTAVNRETVNKGRAY